MDYIIRTAEKKDVMAVYHFVCELEEINFDYSEFDNIYYKNINNKDNYYLVAEAENSFIAGFISCHVQHLLHHCGKVAEIQELFIDARYRQLGIGKQLIIALQKQLVQDDCILIEVTAQNKREGTHAFYQRNDFKLSHKKFVKQLA